MDIRDIQRLLAQAGHYAGAIDGDAGPMTMRAVAAVERSAGFSWTAWPAWRRLIAAGQVILDKLGFEPGAIDGLVGHNTREALTSWATLQLRGKAAPRPAVPPAAAPGPKAAAWPTEARMEAFYGAPGGYEASAGMATLPFAFSLSWNPSQSVIRFACHSRLAAVFTRVFEEAARHYGESEYRRLRLDLFGGCYMHRRKRGGSEWSTHAYGAAVDLDPDRNHLRWGRDRAAFAADTYLPFWRIVEAEGLTSLGRRADFDWMHFQAATP